MDDIKLFTKNGKELKTLIQAERIYSQEIGIKVSIEKCAIKIMKNKYRMNRTTKSRKNQNVRRKENFQMLGNIKSWHHQTSGDKEKN